MLISNCEGYEHVDYWAVLFQIKAHCDLKGNICSSNCIVIRCVKELQFAIDEKEKSDFCVWDNDKFSTTMVDCESANAFKFWEFLIWYLYFDLMTVLKCWKVWVFIFNYKLYIGKLLMRIYSKQGKDLLITQKFPFFVRDEGM